MIKDKKKEKKITIPNDMRMPRSRNQIFTEQENRLLDQITLEITEAWAKDLKVIKECQKKSLATCVLAQNAANLLEERLKELNDFLYNDYGLARLKQLMNEYEEMKKKLRQKKWWEFWK